MALNETERQSHFYHASLVVIEAINKYNANLAGFTSIKLPVQSIRVLNTWVVVQLENPRLIAKQSRIESSLAEKTGKPLDAFKA